MVDKRGSNIFLFRFRGQRVLRSDVILRSATPVAKVDTRFLSFSIDISVLAGGFWWEGSKSVRRGLGTVRVPPLSLDTHKLNLLVAALGPAYLRIGGSEADKIHYFQARTESDELVLTQGMWESLHAFINRHDLKLSFTFKYGLFQKKAHGSWCKTEVEQLVAFSRAREMNLDICELGNELNAYWAFHGFQAQPRAKHLAEDYGRFQALLHGYFPKARVIAPGSAFWPLLGETVKPFSNLTRPFLSACQHLGVKLDIIDWHYYPFQSERAPVSTRKATRRRFLSPHALNLFSRYAKQMRSYRDQYYPGAELWVGETGSAQCGGQPKLSDRFASCFWFADQLGQAALTGHSVMIRQSLIGGDYGLIDRVTLKPRPDYWLAWLWKQLMGAEVFSVKCSHRLLRIYCHQHPEEFASNMRTYVMINLSSKPIEVKGQDLGCISSQYVLTAKKLSSKRVRINGIKARFKKGAVALSDYANDQIEESCPPLSISFWLVTNL